MPWKLELWEQHTWFLCAHGRWVELSKQHQGQHREALDHCISLANSAPCGSQELVKMHNNHLNPRLPQRGPIAQLHSSQHPHPTDSSTSSQCRRANRELCQGVGILVWLRGFHRNFNRFSFIEDIPWDDWFCFTLMHCISKEKSNSDADTACLVFVCKSVKGKKQLLVSAFFNLCFYLRLLVAYARFST